MSEDEEEDWFERAMREAEAGEESEPDEESEAGEEFEPGEESDSPRATADETEEVETEPGANDAPDTDDEEPTTAAESEEYDPFGGFAAGDEGGFSDEEADPFGGVAADEPDPFGGVAADEPEQFGGEPDDAEETFGGGESEDESIDGAEQDPFGQGARDPFGGDEAGGFEAGGETDPFGGGGEGFGGGDSGPDFDEEEFESDIDRIDVGIEGLDEMVLGGIPTRSLMVTIGSAGTGKTTFALQFLTEALENDRKAVYITLEESRDAILSTAEEKGWPFRKWNEEGQLAVVSMDPIEMANSLSSIRNDISRLVEEFDADRLVLDSVSLLEMMYDHPAKRRSEVFDFARSLKRAGVTTMLTSEASSENAYTSRYGIIEYLVDAVFVLQYVRPSDFRETRLAVEIQKIRDANHSRETKPFEITNDGISVYRQANIF